MGLILSIVVTIINGLLNVFFSLFKNTSYYQRLEEWKSKVHIHNRLHSREKINEMVTKLNYDKLGRTEQLNGKNLKNWYKDDMHQMTIIDSDGNKRVIQIPYLEIINFNKHPNTKITISCSEEEPLFLQRKYVLPEILANATKKCIELVKKINPKTTDDPHPRLAALRRIGEDEYQCVLEETNYYTQISSNLSMDYPIDVDGHTTTMRTLEREQHIKEMAEWGNSKVGNDALHPRCLTSLENSLLANVIGVSAIWCMGDMSNSKFYLMPRNKKVGVYKNKLGMPSGDIESPRNQGNRFKEESLIEFLKWEIAREFAEETGIRDINKDFEGYSINVNPDKIKHETEMEIIPLALTREMLRGGKPQMFFLIKTEEIPENVLKKCFLASLGIIEFDNSLITTASLSAEAACNYLYAMEHIWRNIDGEIDLS